MEQRVDTNASEATPRWFSSRSVWVAVVLAVLVVASPATWWYLDRIAPLRAAEESIRRGFNDPAAAVFRNMTIEDGRICGAVNAKNLFGAYVGFREFVVERGGRRIWWDGDQGDTSGSVVRVSGCSVSILIE